MGSAPHILKGFTREIGSSSWVMHQLMTQNEYPLERDKLVMSEAAFC